MKPVEVFRRVREAGDTLLLEDEAKDVLESAGIVTSRCLLVNSPEEAAQASSDMGFPVVLKLRSRKIPHKSDVGGVALNLLSAEEVIAAYRRLLAAGTRIDPEAGLLLQKMARPGVEIIVGVTCDIHFGPVIMLGLGGIFTEVIKDITYRLLPITLHDAGDMICSLQGYPLLTGTRGREAVDIEALRRLLIRVSDLAAACPEIKEMDLNPVAAYPEGYAVLDARIVLEGL